jgi:SHS2 domain-containing protein
LGTRAARTWEHFEHGADVGVRGRGGTVEEAFEGAACALAAIVAEPSDVLPAASVALRADAPDLDLLLVAWLDAVIWEMSARRWVFRDFRVAIRGGRLEGEARGEQLDVARHRPALEVKGATHTLLAVARGEDGIWTAQTVVDV